MWRIFAFFVLFVAVSGKLGPLIINHDLVSRYGFGVYGGAGKALIFAAIAFGLLAWRKRDRLHLPTWRWPNLFWLLAAAIAFAITVLAITRLWIGEGSLVWPALTHLGIVATICCCALGVFSVSGLRRIGGSYRQELLISLAVGIGFYIFLTFVYSLWEVLATTVMHATSWLLSASGLHVTVVPPRFLILDTFGIEISQWCSGIESIALFTGLYAIIGIVDRDRLNYHKFAAVFLPALLAIFGLNIVRVYALIVLGYYVDKHIAFTLFHTYAGMVFFVAFAAVFWRVSYRWMLKPRSVVAQ